MPSISSTRLTNGLWQGNIVDISADTTFIVTVHDRRIEEITAENIDANTMRLSVPIPPDILSEGVNTFFLSDHNDESIGNFTIIAGDLAGDDIRSEVELLRAELDLLKKAFRRHLRETM